MTDEEEDTVNYTETPVQQPSELTLPALLYDDLKHFPIEVQQRMLLERTRQLQELRTQKVLIQGMLIAQNEAKIDEMSIQRDIDKETRETKRLLSSNGEQVGKGSAKEIRPRVPALTARPDNICLDDDMDLVKPTLEAEPVGVGMKRAASEPVTPLREFEPPKKKLKSNSVAASSKSKQRQKCAGCGFEELGLWDMDEKTGNSYCYGCHTSASKRNLCSYKPRTGGRACHRENEGLLHLCSKHKHTTQISEL
jgi:hypothetical protein